VVNLYVTVPAHHPGAHPAGYLSGSFRSLVWAIGHGALTLEIHATLGLALVIVAVGAAGHAARSGHRTATAWTVLGGLMVIGAGFNGASFLDFADNVSSLIMALLALAAVACYTAALTTVGTEPEG
ncbi:MAG: hypothetical protein ACRDL5_10970, partial [Solirubrobacteraceae bacterium]